MAISHQQLKVFIGTDSPSQFCGISVRSSVTHIELQWIMLLVLLAVLFAGFLAYLLYISTEENFNTSKVIDRQSKKQITEKGACSDPDSPL